MLFITSTIKFLIDQELPSSGFYSAHSCFRTNQAKVNKGNKADFKSGDFFKIPFGKFYLCQRKLKKVFLRGEKK